MQEEPIIEATVRQAAQNFGSMLKRFYPTANPVNGICEQNTTFQFAHAFLSLQKQNGACAFMEVPFYNAQTGRPNRIDGYAFTSEIGIFIEAKQLYSNNQEEQVLNDLERLSHENLSAIVTNCTEEECDDPKQLYALILAECWDDEMEAWYESFPECRCGHIPVYSCINDAGTSEETLSWLYAYKPVQAPSVNQ